MANVVEDTLKRIHSHDGVIGYIIVNNAGIPVKSTLDNSISVQYAGLVQQLMNKSRIVIKELDSFNEMKYMRMRTKKHEIIIVPEKDYLMIVVQNPTGAQPPM